MDLAGNAAQFVSTWRQGCAGGHASCASITGPIASLLARVADSLPHSGADANAGHAGVRALVGVIGDLSAVADCPSYAQAFGGDADVAVLLLRLLAGTAVGAWDAQGSGRLRSAVAVVLRHAAASRPALAQAGEGMITPCGVVEEAARLAARLHQLRVMQAAQEVREREKERRDTRFPRPHPTAARSHFPPRFLSIYSPFPARSSA
jgi:signal transduction histidine kinase